jgi:hypothetical protein
MSAVLRLRAVRYVALPVVAAWIIGSLAAVHAQKVKPPPVSGPPRAVWPDADKKKKDSLEIPVKKILGAGALSANEIGQLREYFGTLVKGFTIKEVIPGLWEVRQTMRQMANEAGKASDPAAQAWLRQFLFGELQKIVADAKLPMESRVNALGAIGDLNEKEPVIKGIRMESPPVPLVAATPYLLQIYGNAQTPIALRATALRGLHRHAEFGVNPTHRPAVLAAMLTAVKDANVPKDCSPAAHEFMRSRAAQVLGLMKDPSAAQPLIDVVSDAQASLGFRCDAAHSLGRLTLKPGDPVAGKAPWPRR